jgi:hypothetical protein
VRERDFARAHGLVCLRAREICAGAKHWCAHEREDGKRGGECEVTFKIACGGTCRRRCRGRRGMRGP